MAGRDSFERGHEPTAGLDAVQLHGGLDERSDARPGGSVFIPMAMI